MYARKGYELVKDLANGEKGQLQPFNVRRFVISCQCTQHYLELQALIRKMQEESVDVRETRNSDHYGALIHHLSLIRNKRCLMAYVHNRAEVIQNFAWKVGLELLELPEEIQEKLSPSEKNYFGKHSSALQSSCKA
uniref:GINS subunit domain-containing protein n=1 Tax=Salix viminalis TaxID=40686 RepID=A0A6N2MLY2_SALVM